MAGNLPPADLFRHPERKNAAVAHIEVPSGVRLFATDLDGTLLLPDGTIGARTRQGIDELLAAGIAVVFVTGRPPRWVKPIAEMTAHHGTAIGANGAAVLDLHDERVTLVRPIAPAAALSVAAALRSLTTNVNFAVEYAVEGGTFDESTFALDRTYVPRWEIAPGTEVGDADELLARPNITKILARPFGDHGHDADSLLRAADQALTGLVEVTHSNSDDVLLEMSALGVTKGSTLTQLAGDLGVTADQVVAVGDMPNDVPMLAWAGHSYAVANAHEAVRAAATATIGSNADEGVADLIAAVLRSAP